MSRGRTFVIGALLGACALTACDAEDDTTRFDAGVAAMPGGTGGTTGVGSTGMAGGASLAGGGVSMPAGSSAGMGGAGLVGGSTGMTGSGAAGGRPGTMVGGSAGTAGGGSAGMTGAGGSTGMTGGGGSTGMTGGGGTGMTGGSTGMTGGGGTGMTGGSTGMTGGGTAGTTGGSCPGLPVVTDYSMTGPFGQAMTENVNAGSEGCTLFRPGATLGMNGFKHPLAVWGNGITTTPTQYRSLLSLFASHGIVTIACNSAYPEQPCLNSCMEWLVEQNASGPMAGKLDTTKEFTIGYSWGGGAAIDTATRPNVKATVSFHGMPPRQSPWAEMKAPLLLFTSTGDTFVSASGYVTPNYNSSRVPTFYATLNERVSHTYVMDSGGGAAKEKGPAIAFLLYFGCGVESIKPMFFGSDCTLCKSPWTSQKKPPEQWQ